MDAVDAGRILESLNTLVLHYKTVADLVLEQNHLMRIVGEELKADHQANHYKLTEAIAKINEASRTLARASKDMFTLEDKLTKLLKMTYDTYVNTEALGSQLETPLRMAAEGAKKHAAAVMVGAQAASDGAAHSKAALEATKDLTGKFELLKAEQAERDEDRKDTSKLTGARKFLDRLDNVKTRTWLFAMAFLLTCAVSALIAWRVEVAFRGQDGDSHPRHGERPTLNAKP